MANRVVLGKLPDGNFGLLVSKPTENVLTTASKNMLFDSRLNRTGQVYAGANNIASIGASGDNFLTTNSKSSLGYIPLVIVSEKNKGERILLTANTAIDEFFLDNVSIWKTTTSTFTPAEARANPDDGGTLDNDTPADGRAYTVGTGGSLGAGILNALNVSYFVLRIPCAYGYMTTSNFG